MAHSPYKESIINFIEKHPGCCKMDIAKYITRSPLRNPSRQYYAINTALRNQWIDGEFLRGRWYLYITNNKQGEV